MFLAVHCALTRNAVCRDLMVSLGFSWAQACDVADRETEAGSDCDRDVEGAGTNGGAGIKVAAAAPHKVLIFTQYSRMLDVIQEQLLRTEFPAVTWRRIDGKWCGLQLTAFPGYVSPTFPVGVPHHKLLWGALLFSCRARVRARAWSHRS